MRVLKFWRDFSNTRSSVARSAAGLSYRRPLCPPENSGPFMNPSDLFLAGEIINGGIKLLSKDITQIGHFRRTYKFDTAE